MTEEMKRKQAEDIRNAVSGVGSMFMRGLKASARGVQSGVKKVGGFLDKQFVEPSRRVNQIQREKMEEMSKKAKSGEFNR